MTTFPRSSFALAALFAALATFACGCSSTSGLMDPIATDPLDGYKGNLAEAGVNTEMDWGPKQNLLLSEFKTLREAYSQLEKRLEQLVGENKNLNTRLANEGSSLQREKALRAQAETETEMLRGRRRELEARILSLSLEKAKLEQTTLMAKIEALRSTLDQSTAAPAEAAATPPRSR